MKPSPQSTRHIWTAVHVAAVVALVLYLVAILVWRMAGADAPHAVDGDQHQSIGQYWRYHTDGAMPSGHLLTDYAFAYHSTPLWWLVMASMSTFIQPLLVAKILAVVAYACLGAAVVLVVGRRTDWLLGILVAMLVLRSPDLPEQVTGGMARSLGPALLYLFLFAFMEGRHKLALATLVVQAATYPSVVIPCGLAYGAYCVLKGPMDQRLRRCAGMLVVGLLVLGLGKTQDFKAQPSWGPLVSYAEAQQMPAWRYPEGRFPEVPHRPVSVMLSFNLQRAYKQLGHSLAPEPVRALVEGNQKVMLLVVPFLVAIGVLVAARVRRRRAGTLDMPDDPLFPWQIPWLIVASLIAYGIVRVVSYKLFLPSRQLGYTLQYLVLVGLPMLCWYAARVAFPGRRVVALVFAAALTVFPVFAIRGDGLGRARIGYNGHKAEVKTYEFIRTLPLDEEIACSVWICELVAVLGAHAPYAAKNLTHPIRKGYYEETERRFVATHEVLYATSTDEIAAFVARERVKYFAYKSEHVKKPPGNGIYQPARSRIQAVFDRGKDKPRLLLDPPDEAVLFRDRDHLVLDLTKFPEQAAPP